VRGRERTPPAAGTPRGRFDNYVARTIPFGDTRLLYQHTAGGPVTWGSVRLVRQYPDGTLWQQYWPGLDKLQTRTLLDGLAGVPVEQRTGPGTWAIRGGTAAGTSPDKPSVLWLPVTASDTAITLTLDTSKAKSAGVVWRWDGKRGAGVTVSRVANTVAVVAVRAVEGGIAATLLDDVTGVRMGDGPCHVRVLVRAHRAEVYLNDCWLFGISLTDSPRSGKIGLLVEAGSAAFSRLRIAASERSDHWQAAHARRLSGTVQRPGGPRAEGFAPKARRKWPRRRLIASSNAIVDCG
jgi:hypothetical protein